MSACTANNKCPGVTGCVMQDLKLLLIIAYRSYMRGVHMKINEFKYTERIGVIASHVLATLQSILEVTL